MLLGPNKTLSGLLDHKYTKGREGTKKLCTVSPLELHTSSFIGSQSRDMKTLLGPRGQNIRQDHMSSKVSRNFSTINLKLFYFFSIYFVLAKKYFPWYV